MTLYIFEKREPSYYNYYETLGWLRMCIPYFNRQRYRYSLSIYLHECISYTQLPILIPHIYMITRLSDVGDSVMSTFNQIFQLQQQSIKDFLDAHAPEEQAP